MDRGRRPEHRPVGHCLVADIDAASDVVGFTIAEFFPRQVMRLQQILDVSRWSPGRLRRDDPGSWCPGGWDWRAVHRVR
jgi:hypothetical protein